MFLALAGGLIGFMYMLPFKYFPNARVLPHFGGGFIASTGAWGEVFGGAWLYGTFAAALLAAGQLDEARRAAGAIRRLDPALTIARLDALLPFHRREDFALFADGLRKAGMPE